MERSKFDQIWLSFDDCNDFDQLAKKFEIDLEVLKAIFYRKRQYDCKKSVNLLKKSNLNESKLYLDFTKRNSNTDTVIIEMAKEYFNMPPCIMARFVLKSYLHVHQISPSQRNILTDPSLVTDDHLCRNIRKCIEMDDFSSPICDSIRQRVGLEYEQKLTLILDQYNIPYYSEEQMRERGFSKTPDACLLEPISINGRIVKWIESKAWFGDPETHLYSLREQYYPYYNRFGPGMVIYWFGFVCENEREGIYVSDNLDLSTMERITFNFKAS